MNRSANSLQSQSDAVFDGTAPATVPGCDTGPAARVGFVVRELRQAWRDHRRERPDHSRRQAGEQ